MICQKIERIYIQIFGLNIYNMNQEDCLKDCSQEADARAETSKTNKGGKNDDEKTECSVDHDAGNCDAI